MFVIFLTPTAKSFKPHKWNEGGEFYTPEGAEYHAKQIRKGMKKEYSTVEVIPNSVHPKQN